MTLAVSRLLSRRLFCAVSLAAVSTPLRAEPERAADAWPRRAVPGSTDGRNAAMARTPAVLPALAAGVVDYRAARRGYRDLSRQHDDHVLLLGPTVINAAWRTTSVVRSRAIWCRFRWTHRVGVALKSAPLGGGDVGAATQAQHLPCPVQPYLAWAEGIGLVRSPTDCWPIFAEGQVDRLPALPSMTARRVRQASPGRGRRADRAPVAPEVPTVAGGRVRRWRCPHTACLVARCRRRGAPGCRRAALRDPVAAEVGLLLPASLDPPDTFLPLRANVRAGTRSKRYGVIETQ